MFTAEIPALENVVRQFGHGHLIDLACGTGYWLPFYLHRCAAVTLFDQSARMLRACEMLKASGQFLILDSAWTNRRAVVNTKVGRQVRRLNDGRSFEIGGLRQVRGAVS